MAGGGGVSGQPENPPGYATGREMLVARSVGFSEIVVALSGGISEIAVA